jgi:hypothetical protein
MNTPLPTAGPHSPESSDPQVPVRGDTATITQVDDATESNAAAEDQAAKDTARRTRSELLPGAVKP